MVFICVMVIIDSQKALRMDEERKKLWRMVVYEALLEIRAISWSLRHSYDSPSQPEHLLQEKLDTIEALSEWCHNIAHFSAKDFSFFDEAHSLSEARYLILPRESMLKTRIMSHLAELNHGLQLEPLPVQNPS